MLYLMFILGLVLLVFGGDTLVKGSVGVANKLGVSPLVVGIVLVGFGTSTPELIASILAVYKNPPVPEIAIGNVVGSNIANILLVLAVSALINPIKCKPKVFYRDFSFLAVTTLFFAFFSTRGILPRWNGWVLLLFLFWFIFYNLWDFLWKTLIFPHSFSTAC